MTTVVFVGPTLTAEAVAGCRLSCELRPPARAGDVLQAVQQGHARIALIDGYFAHALPVWHKELLWALQHGVEVWGASSMGALRAAELHVFGMRGVGRIFEAYRDGLFEDDDEVVLAHADGDAGYRALSEPLVNMRVTLGEAAREGVLARGAAQALVELSRSRFYPERSWHQLLLDASGRDDLAAAGDALRRWLGPRFERRVDQKARDAHALLVAMGKGDAPSARAAQSAGGHPFLFAFTEAFRELQRRRGAP